MKYVVDATVCILYCSHSFTPHVKPFNTVKYSFFNIVASHNFWGGGHVIKRELVGQIIIFITATDVFFFYHSFQIPSMYVLVCLPDGVMQTSYLRRQRPLLSCPC